MNDEKDDYYYQVQYKSPTGSSWSTAHTFDDLIALLLMYSEELPSNAELKIIRQYGWDEVERKELERLKKKYEPGA